MGTSNCVICGRAGFLCSDLESPLRTVAEVRQAFKIHGLKVTDWAERHGVHKASVYQMLYKKHLGYHGKAHAIAVLLRLKDGDINEFINSRAKPVRADELAQ